AAGAEGDGSAAPRPKIATVERREASVPRHGTQGASQAPGVSRHDTPNGCIAQHPNVSRRSAYPSIGLSEATMQTPGAKKRAAGTMECVLFESLAVIFVLILRSAHAEAIPPIRTRFRPPPSMRTDTPSCLETHRSARRLGKHLRSRRAAMPLSMRARGAAHFGETNPTGILAKRTQRAFWPNEPRRGACARAKYQPAAARNERRRSFIVSGLLFTMRFATHTCRPH